MGGGTVTSDSLVAEVRTLFDPAQSDAEIRRWLLESAAIAAYYEGRIGQGGVGRMLGLSRYETESFLAAHNVPLHYDAEEIRREVEAVRAASAERV